MQLRTVIRGLRELYGSWKIIWTRRLYDRRPVPASASTSCPENDREPASGSCSLTRQRARVDLPQPDSPTMPSVSPRRTSKLTSCTARSDRGPERRRMSANVRRNTKDFDNSSARSRMSPEVMPPSSGEEGGPQPYRPTRGQVRRGRAEDASNMHHSPRYSAARRDTQRSVGRAGAVGRGSAAADREPALRRASNSGERGYRHGEDARRSPGPVPS